jgi:hypothetical protein
VTRRNFVPPERVTVAIDPLVAGEALGAASRLAERMPHLQQTRKPDVPAPVRLLPPGEPGRWLLLEVTEKGIELAAERRAGFLRGVELLRQLASPEGFVGVRIEDWPAFPLRELALPWPASAVAPGYWVRLLENLSGFGFSRLSLAAGAPGETTAAETLLPREAAACAAALGIEVVVRESPLPEETPTLSPADSGVVPLERLRALHEAALARLANGEERWRVAVGTAGEPALLEPLWHAIAFAGACGWNPAKAELRALRRTFAARFFGPEATPAQEALEALLAASPDEPAATLSVGELFWEEPGDPQHFRRLPGAAGRLARVRDAAEAALPALAASHEHAERNRETLTALEWTARRLAAQAGHSLAVQQVRETYAEASQAQGNARTVSQKTLRAAELLEAEANRLETLQPPLVQAWRQERPGDLPNEIWQPYAARAVLLRERARAVRAARDTYIQTGTLPQAGAVGLAEPSAAGTGARHPGRAVSPRRLPPAHSPAWWPEGGEARVRIEARGGPLALPWEVAVDLRAWAGSEGAFHVGGAALVCYNEATDAVGPRVPCQLTRGGFVFRIPPGASVYYLYLEQRGAAGRAEPREGDPSASAGVRARQRTGEIRVTSPHLEAHVDRETGLLRSWHAQPEEGDELIRVMGELRGGPGKARVRVIEHGPLLVRLQTADPDGRVRQCDFPAGEAFWEWATSAPVAFVGQTLRAEAWQESVALYPAGAASPARRSSGTPARLGEEEVTAVWAGRQRPDGLLLAAIAPEGPVRHRLTPERHDVAGEPDFSHLIWIAGRLSGDSQAPERAGERLHTLADALRQPPTVQLGPVEERRAREF